jgi:hypothetical protein
MVTCISHPSLVLTILKINSAKLPKWRLGLHAAYH